MAAPVKAIDRQTTTPFHLKLFYRTSGFHSLSDFPIPTPSQAAPPLPSHLQIYTWQSCALRELSHLLTSALPNILPSPSIGTRLSFRLVYPDTNVTGDRRGRYICKDIGSVVVAPESDPKNGDSAAAVQFGGEDMDKTLQDARFVIGDYVDCAIFPPLGDGSVAPVQAPGRGGFGRGYNGPGESQYGRLRGGAFGDSRGGLGVRRGDFGGDMPAGEWRRGERLPDSGYGAARGYGGRGRGRGY